MEIEIKKKSSHVSLTFTFDCDVGFSSHSFCIVHKTRTMNTDKEKSNKLEKICNYCWIEAKAKAEAVVYRLFVFMYRA